MHQTILTAMGFTALTLASYIIKFSTSEEIPTVKNHQIVTSYETVGDYSPISDIAKEMPSQKQYGKYTLYEACIFKFIATEGIVLDMYSCAAGYRTFGIGCVADTPEERALVKSGLTYAKVRKHLEDEWVKMMQIVEKDAPKRYSANQKAALSMLFLSIGYERFWVKNRSLRAGYKAGKGIPSSVWLKQCNYFSTKKQKYVRSENLFRSKTFEVALFHNDVATVSKLSDRFHKDAIIIQKRLQIWKSPASNDGSIAQPLALAQ